MKNSINNSQNIMDKEEVKIVKWITAWVVWLIVLTTIIFSFTTVKAGQRGVLLNWWAAQDVVLGEWLHFKIPVYQKIVKLDVQNVKYEVEAIAYSKDIQTVDSKIALNYHLKPELAASLYREIGIWYQEKIINPAVQESVKAATALFTAQELIEQRAKVKEEIKTQLFSRLDNKYIVVDDFSIVNFDFSDTYEQAIEAKQVAQQEALKAKNDLETVKMQAEQRVASAKAEAEAIKIQAEAIQNNGGAEYVQLQWISRWNWVLPSTVMWDAVPMINLNK